MLWEVLMIIAHIEKEISRGLIYSSGRKGKIHVCPYNERENAHLDMVFILQHDDREDIHKHVIN